MGAVVAVLAAALDSFAKSACFFKSKKNAKQRVTLTIKCPLTLEGFIHLHRKFVPKSDSLNRLHNMRGTKSLLVAIRRKILCTKQNNEN